MSLSRFLDSISDDKHFKSVVSYAFGDLGRCLYVVIMAYVVGDIY